MNGQGTSQAWRGAVPEELLAWVHAIRDTTVRLPDGSTGEKYHPDGVRALLRLVVTWNINPRLLDLAFVVATAERGHAEGAFGFFLGSGHFRSEASLRRRIGQLDSVPADASRALHCRFADGERTIWWNRDALVLPPLFELLTVIEPAELMLDCQELGGEDCSHASITAVAGRWQRRMYGWMKAHLGEDADMDADAAGPRFLSQQRIRHFTRIIQALRQPDDASLALDGVLTDPRVLALWCGEGGGAEEAGADEEHNLRSFEHLLKVCAQLWVTHQESNLRQSPHLRVVTDDATGADEITPERLDALVASLDQATEGLLRQLQTPPLSAIKFLKGKEIDALASVVGLADGARQLPLSVLRSRVYAPLQRQLGRAVGDPDRTADLLEAFDVVDYPAALGALDTLAERITGIRSAILHVLLQLEDPHAVAVIREQLPELSLWEELSVEFAQAEDGAVAVAEDERLTAVAARFFQALPQWRLAAPELNRLVDGAQQAWRKLNTQGFTALPAVTETIDELPVADVYRQGDLTLADLRLGLLAWRAEVQRLMPDEAGRRRQFEADSGTFARRFRELYAETAS